MEKAREEWKVPDEKPGEISTTWLAVALAEIISALRSLHSITPGEKRKGGPEINSASLDVWVTGKASFSGTSGKGPRKTRGGMGKN